MGTIKADEKVNTDGGGVIGGNVHTGGGNFVGRDLNIMHNYPATPNQYNENLFVSVMKKIEEYDKKFSRNIANATFLIISGAIIIPIFIGLSVESPFVWLFVGVGVLVILIFPMTLIPLNRERSSLKKELHSLNIDKTTAIALRDRVATIDWKSPTQIKDVENTLTYIINFK